MLIRYRDTVAFVYFIILSTYFSDVNNLLHMNMFLDLSSGKDHINLMLDFAGWVLDANPEEGLKMFTEDIAEVEQLPRPKVLDYLLRTHKDLVIPYLVQLLWCGITKVIKIVELSTEVTRTYWMNRCAWTTNIFISYLHKMHTMNV